MSLQRLLEIDGNYLDENHQRAMRYAELAWARSGSPTERRALIGLLESALVHCHAEGLEYPSVLLKRKKQLERGDWKPKPSPAVTPPPAASSGFPADWIRQANELSRRDFEEQFGKVKRPKP